MDEALTRNGALEIVVLQDYLRGTRNTSKVPSPSPLLFSIYIYVYIYIYIYITNIYLGQSQGGERRDVAVGAEAEARRSRQVRLLPYACSRWIYEATHP